MCTYIHIYIYIADCRSRLFPRPLAAKRPVPPSACRPPRADTSAPDR